MPTSPEYGMERAAHPSPWVERVISQSESPHKYQPRFSELLSPQNESLKTRDKGKNYTETVSTMEPALICSDS